MLARIENNAVAEMRNITMDDVPEHKRHLWRPVVYEGDGSLTETIIEPDRVRIVRSTPPLTQDDYAASIQSHIDWTAQSRGYADGAVLASYITSTIPVWQAEAAAFVPWRDAVWVSAYTALAAMQGGAAPPTIGALIAGLPPITWPE